MKAESVTIKDNGWKWLLAGILGLALIFGGYGLSRGMGMGGFGMGMVMSGSVTDVEQAILEGATMVRIGTALFGERK